MALQTRISNDLAKAAADQVTAKLEAGAGPAYVEIRDGTQPAGPDTAATGTLLASIELQSPCFGAAADANPGGRITMNGTPSDLSANASGTPTWFRAYDSNNVAVIDGSAGTASTDMILDSATITAAQAVTITTWTVTMPES